MLMSLDPGTRLGTFEVLGPLGAGGMGEVYRASDARLHREVAIKILPEAFAQDPDRLARFEREARLLASLNHPGLAAIYGLEQAGSVRYIVMELVPGETLAEKVATGGLPIPEALLLARQIAEALEAAHEKGIVHRDLKPSNIKVTPQGKVKVLDFGLAKAMDPEPEGSDTSKSPTLVLDQTRPGVILGTPEFMSPEQARGKAIDKRTDIWAYGCILFEMLSGRRAFQGQTASDVIAAILTGSPDWSALPRQTPPAVRDLCRRCLEKDPNARLRDIGDARIEIERTLSRTDEEPVAGAASPRRWRRLTYSALASVLAAAVWIGVRELRTHSSGSSDPRYLVVLPFRDLSNPPQAQLLGDGLVETVSARLNRVPGIHVVTPSASIAAADRDKDPFRIAKSLGANLVLRGAIQREGDRMRITYSVIRAPGGVQVAGDDVTGSASDLFALQDRLTDKVAAELTVGWSRRPPKPSGLETASQQERYTVAIGHLQRTFKGASVVEAIRILEALAVEKPEAALVQAALGRAYLYEFNLTRDKSWVEKATGAVARARGLAPELPEVDATWGELLIRTGKPQDAVAAFRRALALQPESFDVLLGLAKSYAATGDARSAEATYRRAIQFQPSYWAGYSRLGGFFYERGQYARAAEMFSRAAQLTPDNARVYSNLGGAEFGRGRFPEALRAFEQSIRIEPTDLAYSNVGTLRYYLGQYDLAASAFEKAITLLPAHYQTWANLGDAYRRIEGGERKSQEAYARAISLAHDELRTNPLDGHVQSTLALCLAKTGKRKQAEEYVLQSLSAGPDNPEFLFNAAIVANEDGRRDEAIARLRRAATAGFNVAVIKKEPDLANLRSQPDFQKIVRGAENNP